MLYLPWITQVNKVATALTVHGIETHCKQAAKIVTEYRTVATALTVHGIETV